MTKSPIQREKNLGSRVALLPGKFFPNRKVYQKNAKKNICHKKKPIRKRNPLVKNIEYIRTVWKITRQSGRFADSLEDFRTVLR